MPPGFWPLLIPATLGTIIIVGWFHDRLTWVWSGWKNRRIIRQHRREMRRL